MVSLTDKIIIKCFNAARRIHSTCCGTYILPRPTPNRDPAFANKTIYDLLCSDKPCMIGRFGSNEIECTVFTRNRKHFKYDILNYSRGKSDIWWYPKNTINRMYYNAGFFSPTTEQLDKLSKATFVDLELLNPLWGSDTIPWSLALEGKRVLVVHPFAETIQSQYAQRESVHKDPRILPKFSLETIKAVQSITGQKPNNYRTWFESLTYMQNEIDKRDYDICIIGCGAYGLLLAAHCKRMGKKAIHLGGATQLLFGIKGKRWENPNYGFNGINYLSFMTPYWVRPSIIETPQKSSDIEGGCYW